MMRKRGSAERSFRATRGPELMGKFTSAINKSTFLSLSAKRPNASSAVVACSNLCPSGFRIRRIRDMMEELSSRIRMFIHRLERMMLVSLHANCQNSIFARNSAASRLAWLSGDFSRKGRKLLIQSASTSVGLVAMTIGAVAAHGQTCTMRTVVGQQAIFGGDNGPAVSANFFAQRGLAFDSKANLYVADTRNRRVRVISPAGAVTTFAGTGEEGVRAMKAPRFGPNSASLTALSWMLNPMSTSQAIIAFGGVTLSVR